MTPEHRTRIARPDERTANARCTMAHVLPSPNTRNRATPRDRWQACVNVEHQRLRHDIAGMPNIDLPDDEYAAVLAAVRKALDEDKYPMSPRLAPLKAALAKLDPVAAPKPMIKRPPLPQAPTRSRGGHGARR